jgi:hypothetical protein
VALCRSVASCVTVRVAWRAAAVDVEAAAHAALDVIGGRGALRDATDERVVPAEPLHTRETRAARHIEEETRRV